MINSVLSAIPNFFMACIEWDQASIDAVDKFRRAFLWKNQDKILGGHCLVAWEVVTMPKKQGGLGIRDLKLHNKAVMANFTAKLLLTAAGPCFSWMATWYISDSISSSPMRHDSHLWRSILRLIPTIQAATSCAANDPTRTSFWKDSWTSLGRLYLSMPILFSFANDKDCTVASQFTNGQWNLDLLLPLSTTAQDQLHSILNELNSLNPFPNDQPEGRLLNTTGKKPTTRDFYRLFSNRGMIWEEHRWIWQSAIPLRHKFFLWLAYRGRLNTKDNMTRKCWCSDAGCDQCPAVESIHHIALHCRQANWVWEKLNVNNVAATSVTLQQFVHNTNTASTTQAWTVCIAACLTALWNARNDRIFNSKYITRVALLQQIAAYLRLWANRKTKLKPQMLSWALKLVSE
jgi:hypothetical protein